MSTQDHGSASSSKLRPENSFDTLSHDAASTPATKAAYEAASAFQAGHRACIDAMALLAAAEAHIAQEDYESARGTLGLLDDLMSDTAGMMTGSRGFVEAFRKQLHPEFSLTEAVSEMLNDQTNAHELLVGASVLARGLKAVLGGDSATHLLRFAKDHIDSLANECSAHEEYAVMMFREFVTVEASPELAVAMSNADKLSALETQFIGSMQHLRDLTGGVIEAFLADDPMTALDWLEKIVGWTKGELQTLGVVGNYTGDNVLHACDRLEAKWKAAAEATP